MNDTIICPHCKNTIPLTEALSHQIQEKYAKFYKIRLEEEKQKISLQLKEEAMKKAKEELNMMIKDKNNELIELKKQNENQQEQLLELNKTLRQIRMSMEQQKIDLEKKLSDEQAKIRETEQKKFEEQYRLKFLEIEKQNEDLKKSLEEARRKAEQGSQQLQGEVLELELEVLLKREFAFDEIKEVPKGIRGADILHVVKNNYGQLVGTIVWESKRTKSWSDGWISKLKEDKRAVSADLAVIISQVLPDGVKNFALKNNVWITNYDSFLSLAVALRESLLKISLVKLSVIGKQDKKEILWNYLTGIEFRQRIEAIADIYSQMQEELEIEKRWFVKKWAKQEKNIRQVIDNISGMDGDLKSIIGKSLPEVKEDIGLNETNP